MFLLLFERICFCSFGKNFFYAIAISEACFLFSRKSLFPVLFLRIVFCSLVGEDCFLFFLKGLFSSKLSWRCRFQFSSSFQISRCQADGVFCKKKMKWTRDRESITRLALCLSNLCFYFAFIFFFYFFLLAFFLLNCFFHKTCSVLSNNPMGEIKVLITTPNELHAANTPLLLSRRMRTNTGTDG